VSATSTSWSSTAWAIHGCSKSCSGNPGHAYLANSNSVAENILVAAHVLGHADFSRNNLLFRRSQQQVGENIVEHAANHARQIGRAIDEHGTQRVEATLDAASPSEQHVDITNRCNASVTRVSAAEGRAERRHLPPAFRLSRSSPRARLGRLDRQRAPIPPHRSSIF